MIKYLLTTILLLSLNSTASEISIDKFKIKMENVPNKEKIMIKNMSDTETYVSVEVYKMEYIDDYIKETKVEDFSNENIIITPTKLILDPKGNKKDQKSIDIINLGKNLEKETLYKVRFKPVVENSIDNGIMILVAYEAYVFVYPNKKHFEYEIIDTKDGAILKNKGNTSFIVKNIKKCYIDKKECISKDNRTILPNNLINIVNEKNMKTSLSIVNYKEEVIKIEK